MDIPKLLRLDIPTAIVIAAAVLGTSFMLGNLHQISSAGDYENIRVYRLNTVTGEVRVCAWEVGQFVCVR